jgi:hypothetical protein
MQEELIKLLRLCIQDKIDITFAQKDCLFTLCCKGNDLIIFDMWINHNHIRRDPFLETGQCYFYDYTFTDTMTYEEGIRFLEMKAFW